VCHYSPRDLPLLYSIRSFAFAGINFSDGTHSPPIGIGGLKIFPTFHNKMILKPVSSI